MQTLGSDTKQQIAQDEVVRLAEQRLAPAKKSVFLAVVKWLFRSVVTTAAAVLVLQVLYIAGSLLGPMLEYQYRDSEWMQIFLKNSASFFGPLLGMSVVSAQAWFLSLAIVMLYSVVLRPRLFGNGAVRGFLFGSGLWGLGLVVGLVKALTGHTEGAGNSHFAAVLAMAALGYFVSVGYGVTVGGCYEWSVALVRSGVLNDFFVALVKALRLDQTEWWGKLTRPKELWAYLQARRAPNGYAMVTMVRRFAIMWKASIPVGRILKVLAEQETDVPLKAALLGTLEGLQNGRSISNALSMFPKTFNPLFIGMCRVGESTGRMDAMLSKLADYLERDFRLRKKTQSALTYPAFVFVVACIVAWGIFTYIVPTLLTTITALAGPNVALPLPTIILGALVHFTGNPKVQLFAVLGGLWISVWFREFVKTPTGRLKYDEFLINVPLIGPLNRKVILTRFCLAFGTLVGAGVPVLMCVELLMEIIDNEFFKKNCVLPLYKGVRAGQNVSVLANEIEFFPDMFCRMIAVAEESGEFDAMVTRLGNFYDMEVQYALEAFLVMIEPIMIFVMGCVVCFVLLSVFLPLYQVVMQIH